MSHLRRGHPLWYAYVLHRVSGLLLALFLPVHFWVLSRALTAPQDLDAFLSFTDYTPVKIAEWGLVFLLSVHFFGGMRLLVLELTPWQPWQKGWAAAAVACSFFLSTTFFLQAI
ncbi:MAG: succinate dehydrogenase, cytochrome b556 subunit [Paracoccaceae bacterium]